VPAIEQSTLNVSADTSQEAKELISRTPKGKAAPVLLIIIGAIAAVNISRMILELLQEYYYGGVIIDARVKPPMITNDVKIPPGTVVVISENGVQATFKKSEISPEFVNTVLGKLK
jgi:hypothetical protein